MEAQGGGWTGTLFSFRTLDLSLIPFGAFMLWQCPGVHPFLFHGWMDGGCCCGVGPVLPFGLSSGHVAHEIPQTDGFMALRLSRLIGSKQSSNQAKIPLQTTHLFFSKVPFTESSGELCYFWAGSISAWHQPGNWTVNILYGWPPLLLCLSIQRVCVVKGEGWGRRLKVFKVVEPSCSVLRGFFPPLFFIFYFSIPLHREKGKMSGKSQANTAWLSPLCQQMVPVSQERKWGGRSTSDWFLPWQEADIWISHLCQSRVWPVVSCLLVSELLNQSWPRLLLLLKMLS